ncbi:MAG: transposase [Thermoplasmata archaeon YP2-bin.285]|uniref:Transposase n=1 Tax=Candidatus Sysuiplasma superficiale TaxID=2823368 RepID=A0A8J8CBR2_9ARCH|nr:transposase [Candidatus Sysuiplasma superficiale]
MTAGTRRRWLPEEKMAVIKEVQEKESVAETCSKYSIDPAMNYRWKESYDSFGIDGLKAYTRRMEPDMRKLIMENARLKKLVAEEALVIDRLRELNETLAKGKNDGRRLSRQ